MAALGPGRDWLRSLWAPTSSGPGRQARAEGNVPLLAVACVCAAIMMLQLLLGRVLSVTAWYHLGFVLVSLATLGAAVGGVLAVLKRGWLHPRHAMRRMGLAALALGLAVPLCFALALQVWVMPFDTGLDGGPEARFDPRLVLALKVGLLAIPYVLSGLVTALALAHATARVHRVYFATTAGAAAGCALGVLSLLWISAVSAIMGSGALAFIAAVLLFGRAGMRKAALLSVVMAAATLTFAGINERQELLEVQGVKSEPRSKGQVWEREKVYEAWHTTSRIAVHPEEESRGVAGWYLARKFESGIPELLEVTRDASGRTHVWPQLSRQRAHKLFRRDVTELVYHLVEHPKVLIAGVGGGKDVVSALAMGAREVTGVELNPRLIEIVQEDFAEFSGNPYLDDRVQIHVDEPRSFVASHDEKYDIIKSALADSWAAPLGGGFVFAESYLLTREGIQELLEHLTPGGFLSLTRWYPHETYRMAAFLVDSLRDMGIEDPQSRLLIARTRRTMTFIVKNDVVTEEDEQAFKAAVRKARLVLVHTPRTTFPSGSGSRNDKLRRILQAESQEKLDFDIPTRIDPPTDDRPFFHHVADLESAAKNDYGGRQAARVQHGRALYLLQALVGPMVLAISGLGIGAVFGASPDLRRRVPGVPRAGAALYFLAVGLGAVLVQVPLLQRFILFLGHPSLARTVPLCTLFVGCGAGGLVGARIADRKRRMSIVLAALAVVVLLVALVLPSVLRGLSGLPLAARITVTIVTVAPLGILLGLPMGAGLVRAHAGSRALVPWVYAVQMAAVAGAPTFATMLAQLAGFTASFGAGAASYLVAAGAARLFFDTSLPAAEPEEHDLELEPAAPTQPAKPHDHRPLAARIREWMRASRPRTWRDLLPPRAGWLPLLSSTSSYLLVIATLGTVAAKGLEMSRLGRPGGLLAVPWLAASDVAVYLGLAAALALAESIWAAAGLVTLPAAVALMVLSALNVAYLFEAGEQVSWEALTMLVMRQDDVTDIVEEVVAADMIVGLASAVLLAVALPIVARRWLARGASARRPETAGVARAKCAAWVAALAALVSVATPRSRDIDVSRLAKSAVVATLRTVVHQLDPGSFEGYSPARIVGPEKLAALAGRESPKNVLIVVLESGRYDHTLRQEHPLADTPNLRSLATRGVVAHSARAALPHTTKSMVSILCARLPLMHKALVELSADLELQCLPAMLREAGYVTAFMQSSFGTFEQRPRLVDLLGFDRFMAWEDIQGQSLGYLGSDDESLVEPFAAWLDDIEPQGRPFLITLLTSASHHPYRLSEQALKRALDANLPHATPRDRYARIIEAKDIMLGGILDALRERNLMDDTIVVVVGDHGEGLGDHGIRQHDSNFYEEGLHVPLVIVGPGVPVREVTENVSLVDVTPTVLGLLDLEIDGGAAQDVDGFDMLAADFARERPRWFGCWFEMRCRGFVLGHKKIVQVPQADEVWYFDLVEDPAEREARALTPELEALLPELDRVLDRRTARAWRIVEPEVDRFGDWYCAEGSPKCLHPLAKRKKYRLTGRRRTRRTGITPPGQSSQVPAAGEAGGDQGP